MPGHIAQLSYISDYGETITAKNFYFKVDYMEPSASAVNGLTVERLNELSGEKTFADHIGEIASDFRSAKLLVAHNFKFDFNFLCAEFGYNLKQFTYNDSFDTMRYFTPILKLPRPHGRGIKYPKLEEFSSFYGVKSDETEKFVSDLFGMDGRKAHDAAFDTSLMYLAVKKAREGLSELNLYLEKFI